MNYLVLQNFKFNGRSYRIGDHWTGSLADADHLIKKKLIKEAAFPTETSPISETPSESETAEGLDSEMGEDLGGYEDEHSYKPKKRGRKKKS